MDSDPLSPRWDSRSSFPRQGRSRLSPSYAPPGVAGPSHFPNWPFDTTTGEFDQLQTTSLHSREFQSRRESPASTPSQHPPKIAAPATPGPSSTAHTQPVLVRAYSGNADSTTAKPPTMSSTRRLFPFKGSKSSAPTRPAGPPLPSDKEFSIESILQAIEPDIQGTLDSIAEICGRSKLSLANEYDSHIAPLGEIRAPPGGLVPVEEATDNDERRADEGVVVFDEDTSIMNAGRGIHPVSFYRYLENLRQASSALERSGAGRPPTTPPTNRNEANSLVSDAGSIAQPKTRDFIASSKSSGRNLLAKQVAIQQDPSQDIATPPILSEVHLDAQPDKKGNLANINMPSTRSSQVPDAISESWQAPELIRSLLGWIKWTARMAGPDSQPALQSAEDRLRAMLEHNANSKP